MTHILVPSCLLDFSLAVVFPPSCSVRADVPNRFADPQSAYALRCASQGCTFERNVADQGSAISVTSSYPMQLTLDDCIFRDHKANRAGTARNAASWPPSSIFYWRSLCADLRVWC